MKTHSEIYANALPLLPREVQDMLTQLPTPDTVKVVRGFGDITAFTWDRPGRAVVLDYPQPGDECTAPGTGHNQTLPGKDDPG